MKNLTMVVAVLALAGACNKKRNEEGKQQPAPTAPTAPTGSATTPPPAAKPAEAPKAVTGDDLVKRYDECWGWWNDGKWDDFKGCYTDDATAEQPGLMPPVSGKDAVLEDAKTLRTAFPDMKGDIQLLLVNGNNALGVVLLSGTNSGAMKTPMGEMPATSKKVGLFAAQVIETDGFGHAKHIAEYMDTATMMGQLNPQKDHPVRAVVDKLPMARESVVAKDDDKEKANLTTDQAFIDAFNKHDAKAFEAALADDVTWYEAPHPADMKKKEVITDTQQFWKGFSDVKITPASHWAAGDYVVTVGNIAGTNNGDMQMGKQKMKKTGKSMDVPFTQIDKLENGKVKGVWIFFQGMAFAQQLGMMPPPPAASAGSGAGSAAKTK